MQVYEIIIDDIKPAIASIVQIFYDGVLHPMFASTHLLQRLAGTFEWAVSLLFHSATNEVVDNVVQLKTEVIDLHAHATDAWHDTLQPAVEELVNATLLVQDAIVDLHED